MSETVSIAIETSCRVGSVALGRGDDLVSARAFEATGRHATQLVSRLNDLLGAAGLAPRDVQELYVSAGPGSFTGLRVGITAARTLSQAVASLRCLAVPTAWALAEARCAVETNWRHLGVIMDARGGSVYATVFRREDGRVVEDLAGAVYPVAEFLQAAPRPIVLIGEGLAHEDLTADDVTVIGPERTDLHLPTAEKVWHVGRRLAREGRFVDFHHLRPIYARQPEAVRLWEQRTGSP